MDRRWSSKGLGSASRRPPYPSSPSRNPASGRRQHSRPQQSEVRGEERGSSGHASEMSEDTVQGESITVVVRARPPTKPDLGLSADTEWMRIDPLAKTATMKLTGSQPGQSRVTNDFSTFAFDQAFGADTTQQQLFGTAGTGACDHFLDGHNVSVMAYGQTGAGKTFTMLGDLGGWQEKAGEVRENAGLVPRALSYIFEGVRRQQEGGMQVKVKVCLIEIYNETVVDLLSPDGRSLAVRETSAGDGAYADQVVKALVGDAAKCLQLLDVGMRNRTTGATAMNKESSRSHLIFTLLKETEVPGSGGGRRCSFNMVDLAGSERQKLSRAEGKHLKEASSINQSLTALGKVIMALAAGSRHVPFRESKLTFLLKHALGGDSKTVIIACVNPARRNEEETLSTLKFASFARKPRLFTRRNNPEQAPGLAMRDTPNPRSTAEFCTEIAQLRDQLYAAGLVPLAQAQSHAAEVARIEGLLAQSLIREGVLRGQLEEERRRHRVNIEACEAECAALEEALRRSQNDSREDSRGGGGGGAVARAKMDELEEELRELKESHEEKAVQQLQERVAGLAGQLSVLMERSGEGGGGGRVEGMLRRQLEEQKEQYLSALEIIREQRECEERWSELAKEGCEKQEELEEEVHLLRRQLELKSDIIEQLNEESARATDGEDQEVLRVQEQYENELEAVRGKVVDLQLEREKEREKDLAERRALEQDYERQLSKLRQVLGGKAGETGARGDIQGICS